MVIFASWRYATLADASKALPFKPKLPLHVGSSKLEYLLTSPGRDSGHPGREFFTAYYSGGGVQLIEWQETQPWADAPGPGQYVVNGTVRGLPASVTQTQRPYAGDAEPLYADLMWVEDGVTYHLWVAGPPEAAVRIAESIPRQ